MGLAQYQIVSQGDEWGVLHDGDVRNRYATKEAAFEAAVAAASLAIREGHEVHISVPDRSSGNQTALGAKNQSAISSSGETLPPRGFGTALLLSCQRCSHFTAELTLTSKRSAVSRRDAPPSTASITRSRRSPE